MAENVKGSIMTAKNRDVTFGDDTKELCKTCGIQSGSTLFVRSNIDETIELECPNCGNTEFRKHRSDNLTDMKGRPLIPPGDKSL